MSDKQFDITPEQKQIVEERAKRRLELRNEFLKQRTDPFRHALGEGGSVFDPAYLRYQSMRVNYYQYFKATPKTALKGVLTLVPFFVAGYFAHKERQDFENSIRRGEVAYKDRRFKFM